MLTKLAGPFFKLNGRITEARMVYHIADQDETAPLTDEDKKQARGIFEDISLLCGELSLTVSQALFLEALEDMPTSLREMDVYLKALYKEIDDRIIVFVPSHRVKYLQPRKFMSDKTKETLHRSRLEMGEAGRCFAVGLYTASVFHCMRGIENCLQLVAKSLDVVLDLPLEYVGQETLINQIEAKVIDLKEGRRTEKKIGDQEFYSQLAKEFRYFKDGWRVRTAHAREVFDEAASLKIIEHAVTFLDLAATRLSEEPAGAS